MIAGAALVAYLVATVGVPLPHRVAESNGEPFPCQDHACGCHSARSCWDHCCCYSPAEKLAWAREHGVEPPPAIVAKVADEQAATLALASAPSRSSRSCCAHHEHRDCSADATGGSQPGDDEGVIVGIELVMGPLARQCRGLVDFFCLAGGALPPPNPVDWQFQWTVVEWLTPFTSPLASRDLAPPVPPPRV